MTAPVATQPRPATRRQVAAEFFGRSETWFREHQAELETQGFPGFDRLTGGWDRMAITRWFDARAGILPPASQNGVDAPTLPTDAEIRRRVREALKEDGKGDRSLARS